MESKGEKNMKAAVVAFGGNALMGHTGKSTYTEQILKTDEMCRKIIALFDNGARFAAAGVTRVQLI